MLTVSIVLYNTPVLMLDKALKCLLEVQEISKIYLIDNSPMPREKILDVRVDCDNLPPKISYFFANENLGYSKGHNILLNSPEKCGKYHLVMNADIFFESGTIEQIISFMNSSKDIGLLMPKILNPDKTIQRQAKLLPTPTNLFARRFLPKFISRRLDKKFELHHYNYQHTQEIPYLNGSFMFFRSSELSKIGGFEEKIFMYGEDLDISRRFFMQSKSVVYPDAQVIHEHQKASFKSLKPLIFHIKGVVAYFNKWGWLFDSTRNQINKRVLLEIREAQNG